MHEIEFLGDLAIVMMVAGLVTIIFHRFKQPVVLGYILAGVIIGPHTPPAPFVHNEETIRTLSELGVVFLMFSLGLEFSLRKLKKVGATAFIAAVLEILLMSFVGFQIGQWFGWGQMDSIFLGAMLAISSTTIIIKALAELGKSKEKFASLIFGILIVEDILAIVMIALLSGMAMTGTLNAADVGITIGKLSIFLVTSLVVGLIAVPRLLGYVGKFKSNEVLLIAVLGLCFGFSLLTVKLGYSVALGAFLIGAIIAEAREIGKVESLMEPVRDMFSAVFFVSIGLLINPKLLAQYAFPIAIITVAVVVGKVITCALGTFIAGHDTRTSLRVGMGLAQIGEFSFIIAALGQNLKVTSDFLYPIAVTVSAITTLLTPYLIKSSDRIVDIFDRSAPKGLSESFNLYTRWISRIGTEQNHSLARKLIRKWMFQVALNATLISALFIFAAFIAQRSPGWLPQFFNELKSKNALLWLAAALASLPLFIASYRKLQALGMLIAEVRIGTSVSRDRRGALQSIISQTIALSGTAVLVLLTMILSSAILPPLNVLIVLGLVVFVFAWLFWNSFIRVYSKAQIALHETFAQEPHHAHNEAEPETPLHGLFKKARLQSVRIDEHSPAAGKLIREVQLRSRTGASIVGIERKGLSLINPGPDEEIMAGDELLLLADEAQIPKATEVLNATPGASMSPA